MWRHASRNPQQRSIKGPIIAILAGLSGIGGLVVRRIVVLKSAIGFAAVFAQAAGPAGPAGPAEPAEVINKYCVTCHNDKARTGGLTLEHADFADVPRGAETWEKVIRKVRAGMMPPIGAARPEAAQLHALITFLETSLDRAAEVKPRPGRTVMHRLNRTEYANAIRDL